MRGLETREFEFTDGNSHDATVSEISSSLESCSNYVWNIAPSCGDLGGEGTYTVEVSNDELCWFDYAEEFVNVNVGIIDETDGVEDVQLSFKFIRVNYNAGTATTGAIKFTLTQKQRS